MNVEIADRLARRRREAGYSQEELALKLGVSRQAVSKWERSESSPDTNNLIALAELYEVSLDDLLFVDSDIAEDVAFERADRAQIQAEEAEEEWDKAGYDDDDDDDEMGDRVESDAHEDDDDDSQTFRNKKDFVHISWRDGVNVADSTTGDRVHVGWDGVHVEDGEGGTRINWAEGEGVNINGKQFDSWKDATVHYHGIDVRTSAWLKFPFPLLALLIYLWIGFTTSQWLLGALVFFSIPLYYSIVEAFIKKSANSILKTLYAVGVTVWFLWMGLTQRVWHPTWLMFLTIPLANWLINVLFKRPDCAGIQFGTFSLDEDDED
jgi:HTH-type transcriptional regulator/antitoxin HipB